MGDILIIGPLRIVLAKVPRIPEQICAFRLVGKCVLAIVESKRSIIVVVVREDHDIPRRSLAKEQPILPAGGVCGICARHTVEHQFEHSIWYVLQFARPLPRARVVSNEVRRSCSIDWSALHRSILDARDKSGIWG